MLAALAYLGWRSVPVCELGKDSAGHRVREEFQKLKADLRFVVESDHVCTPVVYQMPVNAPETHKFSFRCPHCGERRGYLAPSDAQLGEQVYKGVPTPSVYYFDRVTKVSLALAEKYRARGVLVVFEPSDVPTNKEDFQRAISATHVLKYADNRFADFPYDVSNISLEIKTMGSKGLRFRIPSLLEDWASLPAIRVPVVVDTAGAGDWCTAGLLASLFGAGTRWQLSYSAAYQGLRYGQSLAALNCMFAGARGITESWSARKVKRLAAELMEKSATTQQPTLQRRRKVKTKVKPLLCCDPLEV
ncbi:MAG: hypothetical protein HY846_05315 [Nitrosomonadales bacterium]|nr:hypothetical protein [Nitrosomonadales bacterium]